MHVINPESREIALQDGTVKAADRFATRPGKPQKSLGRPGPVCQAKRLIFLGW